MPASKLQDYLDSNNVKYVTINHSPSYTAQEIAASAHIRGKEFAKTVIVKVDGVIAMVVEPADVKVDLDALKAKVGANNVELASEHEFKDQFPGCELGAMPPFGNLYNMDVYMSGSFTADDEIAFNAGSHSQLIRMAFADYQHLVKPKVI